MIAEVAIGTAGRQLELQGASNCRDLGGFSTPDGRTRWGTVFRSDCTSSLTHSDVNKLAERGLRTVIDLRDASELDRARSVFQGHPFVTYVHEPFALPEPDQLGNPGYFTRRTLPELYRSILDSSLAAVRSLFTILADRRRHPVLIHCTHGRDRTGLASALILLAAGVSRDETLDDFMLSNSCLRTERWSRELAAAGVAQSVIDHVATVQACYLEEAIAHLDSVYGGWAEYLTLAGVNGPRLEAFRSIFVEPLSSIAS